VLDGPPNKWTAEDAPALPMEPPTAPSGPVITYPPTNDERLEKLQRSMGKVVFRISSMLDTESIYGEEYGTLTRRFGLALVVDKARGWLLTDRSSVPQPLGDVEVTFGQTLTIDAEVLWVHPQHSLVLLWCMPEALERAGCLDAVLDSEPLDGAEGTEVSYFGLDRMGRAFSRKVILGAAELRFFRPLNPPRFRERNWGLSEAQNDMEVRRALGGVVATEQGHVAAVFLQFSSV
jgi:hypothetical protein